MDKYNENDHIYAAHQVRSTHSKVIFLNWQAWYVKVKDVLNRNDM